MEHLKKIMVMILLIVMISIPVYGTEVVPNNDLDRYIEIINPSVEEDNNIEVRNNFFISFNIKEKADLYLTINKIVPVMDTIFLDKIASDEMEKEEFISSLTLHVLEIRGFIEHEDINGQEKTDYTLQKKEIEDTIEEYVEDYIRERNAYNKYISMKKEIEVLINNIKEDDTSVVLPESYESLHSDYREKRNLLRKSKDAYDGLFKISVLNKEAIQSEGVMPYYEKTIENIKYGSYEMIVELKNEDEFITLRNFDLNIGPRDEVADEVLIEKEVKLIQPISLDELEE